MCLWALGLVRLQAADTAGQDQVIFPRTTAGAGGTESRADAPSSSKAILALAAVCAGAGGWLLWRRRQSAALAASGGRKLKVVETQSLGNRQFLVVADYDGRKILLGVCPGRIEMLTDLSDQDGYDA
jgi:flagellar protein FliO/FliZ